MKDTFVHTNKLINETSPYLLQHAHNPVDWFPWGDEALQKAKREDKPVLVSIGYAACHWCHVMERESFENEDTARLMNEYFVNIKIDREERPDLDHIYMDAVQSMTGSGGWPLNVFLTPEGKPFYGGTYFPPVAGYNRLSWTGLLNRVYKVYRENRAEIQLQAENLTAHLGSSNTFGIEKTESPDIVFTPGNLALITQNILKQADTEWGGFGKAPKFPQTFCIQFLLRQYSFTKDAETLQQALLSLDKMIEGGIYDQLGGGFARYSTDERWLVPHFEKMLYDNALLIGVLAEAFQLTKKEIYAEAIRGSMQFIEREMLSSESGFFSALDADSEGVEGRFYTWGKQEIDSVLGEDAVLFCEIYGITENGNWDHANILWRQQPVEQLAKMKKIDSVDLKRKIISAREKLMARRAERIRPLLDDKILLGWNALMNTACSKAYGALGEERYRQLAITNMRFLEAKMKTINDREWYHTYKNGMAKIPAFLDDYAYLIQAYLQLQEISGNTIYLIRAKELTEWVIQHFAEEESGYFFYTQLHQQDVIVRKKEVYDGAIPSGNAIMASNLYYLAEVFDKREWKERAEKMVKSLHSAILKYPVSFGCWSLVFQWIITGRTEFVIIGKNAFNNLLPLLQLYIPNRIIQSTETDQPAFPLLKGKFEEGIVRFYQCKDSVCKEGFYDLDDFLQICNT